MGFMAVLDEVWKFLVKNCPGYLGFAFMSTQALLLACSKSVCVCVYLRCPNFHPHMYIQLRPRYRLMYVVMDP